VPPVLRLHRRGAAPDRGAAAAAAAAVAAAAAALGIIADDVDVYDGGG